ncbi:protein MODIFIER OF SNC1 11-like isoform X3 [Papaver somniferum]|uniref:protein MODIFIER OF SNC1 11-like isoform X3 n=1 Tax=Papaver somniferum TaxID=3469 RepID=UPI000E6FAB56|nr:protein MODIFIER OF SNC1 11-like isoform X3 [Papaver somniferum]
MATGTQKSNETESKTGKVHKETLETPSSDPTLKQNDSQGTTASIISPDTILQKKISRAERFGMPVQLSEEEKRSTRAKSQTSSKGSEELKQAEELKKKARAERFGISVQSASDDEVKKKARLARFGQTPKIDAVEEDKKKARAARFSESTTVTPGKAKTEEKVVIAAKATGGV